MVAPASYWWKWWGRSREGPHFFDGEAAEKLRRNWWWNKAADAGQKEGRGTRRGRPWVALDRPKNGLQDSDEVGLLQVNFLYHGTSDNLTWNILKLVLNLKFLIFTCFIILYYVPSWLFHLGGHYWPDHCCCQAFVLMKWISRISKLNSLFPRHISYQEINHSFQNFHSIRNIFPLNINTSFLVIF